MWLGEGLLDPMRPELALEGHVVGHGAKRAILVQRQNGQARHVVLGRDVVRHHDELVTWIDGEMDRVLALRCLLVKEGEFARARVNAEGADLAGVAMHRIQTALLAIKGEKGRVEQVSHELNVRPYSSIAVQTVNVDAVAAGIALPRCAAPNIGDVRSCHGSSLSRLRIVLSANS